MIVHITIINIDEDLLDRVLSELVNLGDIVDQDKDYYGEYFHMILHVDTADDVEDMASLDAIDRFFKPLGELSPETEVEVEVEVIKGPEAQA